MGTLLLLGVTGEPVPSVESLLYAAAAGGVGVAGLAFFYYALGRGTMGVIAPLAALIGAGVPVLLAIYNGEQVSPIRLAGIGLALLAVVLISLPGGEASSGERRQVRLDLRDLPLVVLSGLGFAGFFIFIDRASAGGALWWPLTVVRIVGIALVVLGLGYAVLRARPASLRGRVADLLGVARLRTWPFGRVALVATFVVAGVGDLGGNAFFVLARHADDALLSVSVVLSSLYPVITTVLAALLLHERLRALQIVGVILATVSVALLSSP